MTMDKATDQERGVPFDAADAARRRRRSIAIAVALIVMVGLFYAATIIRMGANVMNRPL